MRPIRVSQTGVGTSQVVPLDYRVSPTNVAIGCILSGTATYTIEHTFDDVFSPTFNPATATWLPNAGLTAKTASADGNYVVPPTAVRINIASGTGTVTMVVIQGDPK